jgi:D-glycero-D-manno-heptose 1,7-bisphosphate phosphatase
VMEELAADGFSFIVLTNQAGIGHGIVEQDEADRIHQRMTVELANRGVPILETYCCPDLPGSGSPMRKPAPGMFLQAFSVRFCRRSPDVLDEVRRVLVEVSRRR